MSTSASRPNVLWICTDQQRHDTLASLGNPVIHTPNLDRLVQTGVAFTHAFCQNPICQPSRASFMTGLYPSTLHVNGNGVETFPKHVPVVSKMFADASYACGLIGKLHLNAAYHGVEKRVDDGYTYWRYSHGPYGHLSPDERGHDYADWLRDQGQDAEALLSDPDRIPDRLHHTTWCVQEAETFIRENVNRPWFASVNIFAPHKPFTPPAEYVDHYDPEAMPPPTYRESDQETQGNLDLIPSQGGLGHPDRLEFGDNGKTERLFGGKADAGVAKVRYYGMISHIDEKIGALVKSLEETGQRENTILIFMSDHGELLGDHGRVFKGCRFSEGLVRVPLIWNWPGRLEEGLKATGLVELIDVLPTLLELCDLELPDHIQGRSLVPILTGGQPPDAHRDFVRCEFYDAQRNLNREGQTGYGTMYRDERYKLVVYHNYDLGELYDLEEDPGEFNNRWADPEFSAIKMDLMKKSFDATVLITDWGGVPYVRRKDTTPGH